MFDFVQVWRNTQVSTQWNPFLHSYAPFPDNSGGIVQNPQHQINLWEKCFIRWRMDDGTCEIVSILWWSLYSYDSRRSCHRRFIDPGMKEGVHRTSAEGRDQDQKHQDRACHSLWARHLWSMQCVFNVHCHNLYVSLGSCTRVSNPQKASTDL